MSLMVFLTLSLSGFVHGMSGFGFGLIAMALLPLWMDFKDAVALVALFNVLVSGIAFAAHREHFEWRSARTLVIGSCLGVPLGVFALGALESATLIRLLGLTMVGYVATEYAFAGEGKRALPTWSGFPLGVVGGALGGAFNMGGPPVIAYVFSQSWSKQQIIATLQVVFGASAIFRIAMLAAFGLMQRSAVDAMIASAIPVALAMWAGTLLLRSISVVHLRRGASFFLVVMGLRYILFQQLSA